MTAPKAPAGTGAAGRRMWKAVVDQFDLDGHHLELLKAAVKVADIVEDLDEMVAAEGLIIESPHGAKANPALVEARQQRALLARLIAGLGLPDSDTGRVDGRRKGKSRAPYRLHAIGGDSA